MFIYLLTFLKMGDALLIKDKSFIIFFFFW